MAHPGLTRTDHFGKADTDVKWSSAGVERFANSFWGTEAKMGAIPLMFACTETSLAGKLNLNILVAIVKVWTISVLTTLLIVIM